MRRKDKDKEKVKIIKKRRKELDMTQSEYAKRLGVSRSTIARIENEKNQYKVSKNVEKKFAEEEMATLEMMMENNAEQGIIAEVIYNIKTNSRKRSFIALREMKNLTKKEMAEQLGITVRTVNRIEELDNTYDISGDLEKKINCKFHCDFDSLAQGGCLLDECKYSLKYKGKINLIIEQQNKNKKVCSLPEKLHDTVGMENKMNDMLHNILNMQGCSIAEITEYLSYVMNAMDIVLKMCELKKQATSEEERKNKEHAIKIEMNRMLRCLK